MIPRARQWCRAHVLVPTKRERPLTRWAASQETETTMNSLSHSPNSTTSPSVLATLPPESTASAPVASVGSMLDAAPTVFIIEDRGADFGWPNDKGRAPGESGTCPAAVLLTHQFECDAHFVQYSPERWPAASGGKPCRLALSQFKESHFAETGPIRMVLIGFDVDDPVAHANHTPFRDEWFAEELPKITRFLAANPAFAFFCTGGGYRLVARLPQGVALASPQAVESWKWFYAGAQNYLKEQFGIEADRATKPAGQLFRTRFVLRNGKRTTDRVPALGDLSLAANWTIPQRVLELAQSESLRPAKSRSVKGPTATAPERLDDDEIGVLPEAPYESVQAASALLRAHPGKSADGAPHNSRFFRAVSCAEHGLNVAQIENVMRRDYLPRHTNCETSDFDLRKIVLGAVRFAYEYPPALGADPIARDALVRLASGLERRKDTGDMRMGQIIRTAVDGHAIEPGTISEVAQYLGRTWPQASAPTVVDHFKASFDLCREAGKPDPVVLFTEAFQIEQRKCRDQAVARSFERESSHVENCRLAWAAEGIDRATEYAPEELARWEADGGSLARRWILQKGRMYFVRFGDEYVGPLVREELSVNCLTHLAPARSAGVTVHTFDERGNRAIKDHEQLISEYGQPLKGVEYDWTGTASRIEKGTLKLKAGRLRTDLAPAYDPQVEEWLRIFAGPQFEALCDWIATVTWLSVCAPALYLKGGPGIGKNLLIAGLQRLWATKKATTLNRAMGEFNADLLDCPLVFADEKVPESYGGAARTEELRALITAMDHSINQKNMPHVKAYGAARVVIGANNMKLITSAKELTPEDAEALADRVLFIVPDPRSRAWLESRGGPSFTHTFVEGDRIARHALWLDQQARTRARPISPGKRLLLPGNAEDLTRLITVGSGLNWRVMSWVHSFLQDQNRHIAGSMGRAFGALVKDAAVWISTTHMLAAWDQYLPNERPPTLEQLTNALRSLLVPANTPGGRYRTRLGVKAGKLQSYQKVRPDAVAAWVDAENGQEGLTELTALLSNDTPHATTADD
jgi:Family of unknown function (DUF5906)